MTSHYDNDLPTPLSSHSDSVHLRLLCSGTRPSFQPTLLYFYHIPSSLIPPLEPRPSSNSLSRYPRLYTQCFYNQFWWNKTYTNFPGHNARCKHSTDRIGLYCKNPLSSFPKASTVLYLLNTFFSLSPFSAFTYLHMTRQEINSVFHMFNTNGNILAFSPTQ